MKRCLYCFREYENAYTVCPYCGYAEGTPAAEPQYLQPGTLLASRYLVGAVIGAGGFGVTYGAWDRVLDQRVAVKEFLPGEFSTRIPGQTEVTIYGGEKTEQFRDGKNKFYEESRRLAKLQKVPGIVQIYNSFLENGTAYIVMEYLEGETLGARLKREGKLPLEEAIRIITPVLYSLEAVHREGILHRDIAPNNIFLTKEGQVKLLDFGAARSVTGTHSKSLTVLYKEGYTPEEQYRSHGEQGPWTDVYEAAATLYKMLTGITPPGALDRRRKDTLREPSKAGAKVPKAVDTALMNALNVEVRNRTQSAGQFLEELTGDKTVKSRYVRTEEKKAGQIPLGVKIGGGAALSCMVLFLLLLSGGVIRITGFSRLGIPEGMTRVPNVVNIDLATAQKRTEEAGLSFLIVDKQFSTQIPEDMVLSQSSSSGSLLDQGAELQVVVSAGLENTTPEELEADGVELIEIPDVQYQDRDEAMSMLLEAGLEVQVEYETTGIVEGGRITRQSVEPGERLVKGDTIVLTVEDFVVDWTDASVFEELVREALQKQSGDIYASEMLRIEELPRRVIDEEVPEIDQYNQEEAPRYSVRPLGNCLNLKELYLSMEYGIITADNKPIPQVYLTDMEELRNLYQLETLTVYGCGIEDVDWLRYMQELENLSIRCTEVMDIEGIRVISGFSHLKKLDLAGSCIEMQEISFLSNLAQLESLDILYNTVEDLSALESMKKIRSLGISNADNESLSIVNGLETLESLRIFLGTRQEADLTQMKDLKNLESLVIIKLSNTTVQGLEQLPSLKSLSVQYCDNLELEDFTALTQLEELYIITLENGDEIGWNDNRIDDLRALQQAQ